MTVVCKAVCSLASESGGTIGHLTLTQASGVSQPVQITGSLTGLTAGKHGLSICVSGDLTNGATSCGPIFNPFGKTHGAPTDDQSMVGDLGNVVVDEKGNCQVEITDERKMVQLIGPHSVIGRSMVLYAGEDDQGRGGHENSLTTGNAGPRIAAGVIGLAASS